ncbi:MAG TPA: glutamyl-tRNA reductase [Vicinamibacteria bacterium]|nr:glutamyl-tRNA reductase [Vicinamibacteria bacterium]
MAGLHIVGLSHRTAPLEVREALAFAKDALGTALQAVRELSGAAEAMILSTCNRVEVYARSERPDAAEALLGFLCGFHGRDASALGEHLYHLSEAVAVLHAFRVAASLDSMVIGEPQILGQVREAYLRAEQAGTLGPTLGALRNRTIAAARRARAETGIGAGAVSVSFVAVELARKIFGQLDGRNVLLVGAGKMSELAARHLVSGGALATVVASRTMERAAELAAALGGHAVPIERLREALAMADIVISGTGAPGLVVSREDVEVARAARRARPLFLIDIAVPRDIDPSAGRLEGVFLYDLDDLRSVSEANLRQRRKQAAAAEALIEKEAREFVDWEKSLEVVPLLVELRSRADNIRRSELAKVRARLGALSPEQEEALEAATSAIVNKLLHPPTVHLKEATRNGQAGEQLSLIRKLLGL